MTWSSTRTIMHKGLGRQCCGTPVQSVTFQVPQQPFRPARTGRRRWVAYAQRKHDALTFDSWYTPNFNPKKFVGPLVVRKLEGKGRGVVATRPVQAGELLMASEPVLSLYKNKQEMPQPDALAKGILEAQLPEHLARWLTLLYHGTDASIKQLPALDTSQGFPDVISSDPHWLDGAAAAAAPVASVSKQMDGSKDPAISQPKPATGKRKRKTPAVSAKGFGEGPAVSAKGLQPVSDAARRRSISQMVSLNCFGEYRGDLAAATERAEEPVGFIGLWPEFSLLNHSCAPNTSNWVLGNKMLVRAVRPIAEGEEVCVSYLGRPQLAPLDVRREQLRETYGFSCECVRCQVELDTYDAFGSIVDAAHRECEEQLQSAVSGAQESGNREALLDVRDLLQSHTLQLNAAFRTSFVAPAARLYGQASMFMCLELLRDCQRALGEDVSHTSLTCVRAVEAVSPGSDIHAILAAQHAEDAAREHGESLPQAAAAWKLCETAHMMRYGPVSGALLRRLAHSNATLYD